MKKLFVCFVIFGMSLLGTWSNDLLCQTQLQLTPEQLKALKAAALVGYIPDKFQEEFRHNRPLCTAITIPSTGEVWMSWMTDPKASWAGGDAGFSSNPLTNSGSTDWGGVTITATFQVVEAQGMVLLYVAPMVGSNYSPYVAYGNKYVSTPGTYEVTTAPFVMKPGIDYRGVATIGPSPSVPNRAFGTYVKVISIKWNL